MKLPPHLERVRAAQRTAKSLKALAAALRVSEGTASNYLSILRSRGVRVVKFRAGRKAS